MRDWGDVLPEAVAIAQHRFERDRLASNMRRAGMTLREAGNKLGICQEQVRIKAARYERVWGEGALVKRKQPIEEYLESGTVPLLKRSSLEKWPFKKS